MSEDEWLASTDLAALMASANLDGRKLRLFAAACARLVWHLLDDDASRIAIELSERAADHPVADKDLDAASGEAERAFEDHLDLEEDDPRIEAAHVASSASNPDMTGELVLEFARGLDTAPALLRDVVNPFSVVTLDPAWLTSTVATLAQAAYDERTLPSGHLDTVRLAVLADALEEAGRASADVQSHLRSPGPHVRGCWVIDLILGKK